MFKPLFPVLFSWLNRLADAIGKVFLRFEAITVRHFETEVMIFYVGFRVSFDDATKFEFPIVMHDAPN